METSRNIQIKNDISIVLCGQAGQGVQTIEQLVTRILKNEGYNVFSTSEFMSRIRGGSNSTQLRVSSRKVAAYVDRMDIFIPLDDAAIAHCEKRIGPSTLILGETARLSTTRTVIDVPFTQTAIDVGGALYASAVAAGAVCGLFDVPLPSIEKYFREHFSSKKPDVAEKNISAASRGHALGRALADNGTVRIDIDKDPSVTKELFLNGAQAVGLGALAGGCDFVSSYPMSPSTGVLTFLAGQKNDFGIIVEQAEDEIAAVNMVLGAWYAGGRGLVTTSGGGFALMTEGVSLCGMLELPLVVHVGQRPGPATGLPTRTEQADLDLVLYAGHGEFPRVVFAPGSLSQAVEVMVKAFHLADKYQIPVFVLTDQFFLDSYAASPSIDLSSFTATKHIVKTASGYKRYDCAHPISPRGIPGYGDGIVCVDSDEHTEEGYITEDLDLRTRMVDKRLLKCEDIAMDSIPPRLIGYDFYTSLVVCWGSNFQCVREAIAMLGKKDMAMLHIPQLHPFHPATEVFMLRAQKLIVVENNATSQLSKLIRLTTGLTVHKKILKYNGLPFSVEEIVKHLAAIQ